MYDWGNDRRSLIYILATIMVIMTISRYISNPAELLNLLLAIPGILIAITFHEYAHAFVADKLGDDTPRRQGRLSLNPLAHMDPYGTLLMLFAGFGWGKPVEINPNNFVRTISIRKGEALVAIAGPLMNLILSVVFSVIYGLLIRFTGNFFYTQAGYIISIILEEIITMNVALFVFNLIPLPPLDGSKVIMAFLPSKAQNWYIEHERVLYVLFLIIWITPISNMIVSPIVGSIGQSLIKLIHRIAI